ncbi:MAG: hypothetical protein E6J84_15200 [Deltaproteobacteria bacterium]|nr:MAG: hypothetical protein E6J84_15200 [Deltaproteobacteria bacterium]
MDVKVTSGSGLQQDIQIGRHRLVSDEPQAFGGADLGPSPYELLAAAIGACTSMTLRMCPVHRTLSSEVRLVTRLKTP